MSKMELCELTIKQAHQGLLRKDFSALELTRAFLNRIKRADKEINAFLTVSEDLAVTQAKNVDKEISSGEGISVLAGVPFCLKDNILIKDLRCTAGSRILENYVAPYDATVVRRLKELGGVILGKTNMDEFAMGSSCENSAFFPTKNPYDLKRVPGGSSGGSAAAVAANMTVFSLGSDTAGSVRQPASFCGVVGFKPTYGAVSRYGLIAMASSLDQIGPITKNVEDAEIVSNAIFGKDKMDQTSVELEPSVSVLNLEELRIGIPKEYFIEGMEKEVKERVNEGIGRIERAGAKIEEISLPHTPYAVPAYYVIVFSEISANLARYDGIRYGYSAAGDPKIKTLLDVYLESRKEGLGKEVKRRIMLGTYTLSRGYYDAYYLRAQKVRAKIKEDFDNAFKKVEAIITPVSPTVAFKIGERIADPLEMYLSDIFTASVNLAGLPAISLPCGKANNLPVGLQIIGKSFEDRKVLEVAKVLEKILK